MKIFIKWIDKERSIVVPTILFLLFTYRHIDTLMDMLGLGLLQETFYDVIICSILGVIAVVFSLFISALMYWVLWQVICDMHEWLFEKG